MIESNASIYDRDFRLFKLVADALERDDGWSNMFEKSKGKIWLQSMIEFNNWIHDWGCRYLTLVGDLLEFDGGGTILTWFKGCKGNSIVACDWI